MAGVGRSRPLVDLYVTPVRVAVDFREQRRQRSILGLQLIAIARAAGRSPVSFALNWLLHHTTIDCVILGASRIEQLEENLKAMEDGGLPEGVVAACDAVWAKLRGVTPQYNR